MNKCRICSNKIILLHRFEKIALVGNFLKRKNSQKKYKISLNYCSNCWHVQIAEILSPEILFKDYAWQTGISKSNISLINSLSRKLEKYEINKNSKVLEIASNDGSLIKFIHKKYKSFIIGVDPAKNLVNNIKKNLITISDFFSYKLSKKIKKKFLDFNFIIARNVIAHVKSPNDIFKGVFNLLKKNGIFIVEVPHLYSIIKENQYDNIFHEHLGFHSLKSLVDLCDKNKLQLFDVEIINSQGGSLRCYISKQSDKRAVSKNLKKILYLEKKYKLFSVSRLKSFKLKIKKHIKKLNKLILKIKKDGSNISVYGASGKGQALMQYCKINNQIVDYVFDKSKIKQGCYTPGTNIPILSPDKIKSLKIDYLLLLTWNLKKEIFKQEKKFIKAGGKFIIPFPSPKIIR